MVELEDRALAAIRPPVDDVVVPIGVRNHVISRDEFAEWVATATSGVAPINQRRERLTAIARRELMRRTGDDALWSKAAPLKAAITKTWPTQKPVRLVDSMLPGASGKRRQWTAADQLLVDEANSMLNGSPFTYGHVVVDEAQDHSDVALRVIGRRSPNGSMTLVGDVAQSTSPAGQERWSDVFAHLSPTGSTGTIADLTIGYRVPEPILRVANRLLPLTEVDATESRSVRSTGAAPSWNIGRHDDLASRVASATAEMKRVHKLTGVVAPPHRYAAVASALAAVGLTAVDHVHELEADEVPVFGPHAVKGLEFDGVIVVNPHEILGSTALGARLLYVAMTRAVQRLAFVTDAPSPVVISP